jgi:hypothetical protein
MEPGFSITIVDPDDDYLGIEMHACNGRFAGSARIYAGFADLTDFATQIVGFPKKPQDQRTYEFGSREASFAGGYCNLRFHCLDWAGHATVEVVLEDDDEPYAPASAKLSFRVEAAGIDRFIASLRGLEHRRCGAAVLPSVSVAS